VTSTKSRIGRAKTFWPRNVVPPRVHSPIESEVSADASVLGLKPIFEADSRSNMPVAQTVWVSPWRNSRLIR